MEKKQISQIRKLTVGINPKDAEVFVVGQTRSFGKIGRGTIASIVRDENNFYFFGQVRYTVYVKIDGSDELFDWRHFEGQTVDIECAL